MSNFKTTNRAFLPIFGLLWVMGWVVSEGFWSTFFSIFFPPWAWFLSMEVLLDFFNITG